MNFIKFNKEAVDVLEEFNILNGKGLVVGLDDDDDMVVAVSDELTPDQLRTMTLYLLTVVQDHLVRTM